MILKVAVQDMMATYACDIWQGQHIIVGSRGRAKYITRQEAREQEEETGVPKSSSRACI